MNIQFTFSIDPSETLNETFIRLWRLTNGANLIMHSSSDHSSTSAPSGPSVTSLKACQRLNYRSWRLLNSKTSAPPQNVSNMLNGVLQAENDSSITLHHELQPFSNQFLAKRDSLFSNNSKTTLFLHSSTSKSLNDTIKATEFEENDSASDISDISDISEEDEDEFYDSSDEDGDENGGISTQDDLNLTSAVQNPPGLTRNDSNLPSETAKTSSTSPTLLAASDTVHSVTNNSSQSSNVENSVSKSPPLALKRSRTSFVRGFNPDTLSVAYVPHQVPLLAPQTVLDMQVPPSKAGLRGLKVFYIANSPSPPDKEHSKSSDSLLKLERSTATSSSSTNLKPGSGKSNGLTGAGVSASISSINDDSSAWLSVSEDDEQLHEDKEEEIVFDKRSVRNIPVSGGPGNVQKHEPVDQSKFGSESLSIRPRSLLSGLFLNRLAESPSSNGASFSKPSLTRSSTADGIRYNKQGSLLYDRNLTPSGQRIFPARSLLFYNSAAEENKDVVVGISDFNVVKQPSIRSNSAVNIIEEEEGTVRANTPTERPGSTMSNHSNASHSNQNAASAHERLSTSLNKYSESISRASLGISINNLFLKSSKNLSGLFNTRSQITAANAGAGEVILSRKSFVNGIFSKRSDDSLTFKKEKPAEPVTQDVEISKNKLDITQNGYAKGFSDDKSTTNDFIIVNNGSKMDDDTKEQEIGNQEPPKETKKEITVDNKFTKNRSGSIRFSNELSESLKDSILIDRKLGKIPMSEKILPSLPIELGNFEKLMSDDYHSKGW